jgi:hypothetical protein
LTIYYLLAFRRITWAMVFIAIGRAANEQDGHRRLTYILKRVRFPARDENGVACFNHADFPSNRHSSRAFQNVVNLFSLYVVMPPDGCADRQHFFSEAASFNARRGAINERANLRAVRGVDDGGALTVYHNHLFNDLQPVNFASLIEEIA